MAIVFKKKSAAPAAAEEKPVKKAVKKVEDEVEETDDEEVDSEEEEADEEEVEETKPAKKPVKKVSKKEEVEEDDEEEEAEEEDEESEEEADEEEDDEEEAEEEEAPKKAKLAKKSAPAPKKSAAKKTLKKSLKTTSLSSFGQKTTAAKESWEFTLDINEEEVSIPVPGKKPNEDGLIQRDQLMSIFAGAIKEATGNDISKKDAEGLFGIFETVMMNVTEQFAVNFMGERVKHRQVPERVYPPLKSENCTFFPAHVDISYRRTVGGVKAYPIKTKGDKPVKDKNGNFIRL